MAVDREALAKQVAEARSSLISKGGEASLRFSINGPQGWQATNSQAVSKALCALWNAAPELLGIEP